MSAAGIIEQIKKLTPEDRQKVQAYLTGDSSTVSGEAGVSPQLKTIPSGTFETAKKRVFDENRELLARLAK